MPRFVRARWLAPPVAALAVALAAEARAAFEPSDTTWEGCSDLLAVAREELGPERVVVSSTLDWRAVKPEDALLILHPRTALDPDEAAAFMKVGGRLAVVDDHGRGDQILRHFKIERRGLPTVPARYLRGNTELAVAVPSLDPSSGTQGLHPTVVEVSAVVLNHATGLTHPDLTPVLEVHGVDDGIGAAGGTVAVAVAGQVERGRILAFGDPSAFINLMMRYPGNRSFARGVVRYLANGDPAVTRRGRLFVLVNDFSEANSFTGETPLKKTIDRNLRTVLAGLESLRDEGFPWWLRLLAAAACGFGVVSLAARTMMKVYAARLPRFAREVPLVMQGGVAGRTAVMAASGTPLELAMLELRAALVEALALELGRSEATPAEELVEAWGRRASIEPTFFGEVRGLVLRMRAAEDTVTRRGRSRLRRVQVVEAARLVERVIASTRLG